MNTGDWLFLFAHPRSSDRPSLMAQVACVGWSPYTNAHQNQLRCAKIQKGIFNLWLDRASTQGTSVILSPDPVRCIVSPSVKLPSVVLSPDPGGLYGQPKREACQRTQNSNPLQLVQRQVCLPLSQIDCQLF